MRFPNGNLVALNGLLYGTTTTGGGGIQSSSSDCCGTVFAVNPSSGQESVVYRFKGGTDGAQPMGNLVALNDMLYGATYTGGGSFENCPPTSSATSSSSGNCGTVFAVNPSTGAESVLYSFKGGKDGSLPAMGLVTMNGLLYGVTIYGGTGCASTGSTAGGCGTVFQVNPSTGAESVLYSFKGGTDGIGQYTTLIAANGMLYGTTDSGGPYRTGTIFAVNPSTGAESVLYKFQNAYGDAAIPAGGLIAINDLLYGTTSEGGASGNGTIFEVSASGTGFTILYSFNGASGGAGLIDVSGTIYGAGTTVFSFNTVTSRERIIYHLRSAYGPSNNLTAINGILYGTTYEGGAGACQCGVIYELTPPY